MMTNQNESTSKRPTHNIYITRQKVGDEKPDWIRVGSAWEHGDGEGLQLSLNILGATIPLVIRKNKPKPE